MKVKINGFDVTVGNSADDRPVARYGAFTATGPDWTPAGVKQAVEAVAEAVGANRANSIARTQAIDEAQRMIRGEARAAAEPATA